MVMVMSNDGEDAELIICPKCGGHEFKRLGPWHPLVVLYRLTPVFVFNELILGHRVVRETLICRSCDEPWADRVYLRCPGCNNLHSGRLWSWDSGPGVALGQWFGYVCPSCGEPIPCIWNFWSLLILAVTFPLWYFPAQKLRPRRLERQKGLLRAAQEEGVRSIAEFPTVRIGVLVWGCPMFALFGTIAIVDGDMSVVPITALMSALGGLGVGLAMKFILCRRPRRAE